MVIIYPSLTVLFVDITTSDDRLTMKSEITLRKYSTGKEERGINCKKIDCMVIR